MDKEEVMCHSGQITPITLFFCLPSQLGWSWSQLPQLPSNHPQENYRIVRKNWDTQRIGTRLKIVKIIILADPKNWTILRKRKNIRNFSDPKNWDSTR